VLTQASKYLFSLSFLPQVPKEEKKNAKPKSLLSKRAQPASLQEEEVEPPSAKKR
jgi:hypothetical protein